MILPKRATFNAAIASFVGERWVTAIALLCEMRMATSSPDSVTYRLIIAAASQARAIGATLACYREAQDQALMVVSPAADRAVLHQEGRVLDLHGLPTECAQAAVACAL